jgi:hypothetical protein
MSQEYVEIARRIVEAFNDNGTRATLPFLTDDLLSYPFPNWVEDAVYHGHDGALRLEAIFKQNLDAFTVNVHEMRDLDDGVLVLYEQSGRIKGTDSTLSLFAGLVASDFRDGKVGQVRYFPSWAEALKAVGLEE